MFEKILLAVAVAIVIIGTIAAYYAITKLKAQISECEINPQYVLVKTATGRHACILREPTRGNNG